MFPAQPDSCVQVVEAPASQVFPFSTGKQPLGIRPDRTQFVNLARCPLRQWERTGGVFRLPIPHRQRISVDVCLLQSHTFFWPDSEIENQNCRLKTVKPNRDKPAPPFHADISHEGLEASMKHPPAFQFYASDYLSSSKVQRMTLEAQGAYVRLLAFSWQDGFIPADIAQLARLCACSVKKMAQLWDEFLRECFVPRDDDPDKLVNRRLEEVRCNLLTFKKERSDSGYKGAQTRWKRDRNDDGSANGSANGSAIEQPLAKNGSPVSSLQSPSSYIATVPKIETNNSIATLVRTARKTRAPDQLEITESMRQWARENGITVDLDAETAAMLDHHRAKGNLHVDWVATWRTWMRNSKKYGGQNGTGRSHHKQSLFAGAPGYRPKQ